MPYYVCFEAENITAGVERGRGEDRVIKTLKRVDGVVLVAVSIIRHGTE